MPQTDLKLALKSGLLQSVSHMPPEEGNVVLV